MRRIYLIGSGAGGGGGITSINSQADASQTLAVGTAGSDFAVSSSSGTHTFNLPDAGASARGAVTTGAQVFAGAKTFNADVTLLGDCILDSDAGEIQLGAGQDVILGRDAAQALGLRHTGGDSNLSVYGAYTNGSNYERVKLGAHAGLSKFAIIAQTAGTGTKDDFFIGHTFAGQGIRFVTNSTVRWGIYDGLLQPEADSAYDFGADAKRTLTGYFDHLVTRTFVRTPVSLSISAAAVATDAALSDIFEVDVDGDFTLSNPTNPTDMQIVMWRFINDVTGGHTITLDSGFDVGDDITVTLTAGGDTIDVMTAQYDSSVSAWQVLSFVKGYSAT